MFDKFDVFMTNKWLNLITKFTKVSFNKQTIVFGVINININKQRWVEKCESTANVVDVIL